MLEEKLKRLLIPYSFFKLLFWSIGLLVLIQSSIYSQSKKLASFKEEISQTPYLYETQLNKQELLVGEKIYLSNQVSRGKFKVAGSTVKIQFSSPVFIEKAWSLDGEAEYGNLVTNFYQGQTDKQGQFNLIFSIKEEGDFSLRSLFLDTRQVYTLAIQELNYRVFSSEKLLFWFWTTFLFLIFFYFVFLYMVKVHSKTEVGGYWSAISFSHLVYVEKSKHFYSWLGMYIASILLLGLVTLVIHFSYPLTLVLWFIMICLTFPSFKSYKPLPWINSLGMITTLILFDSFLSNYLDLQSLSIYLDQNVFNLLIILFVLTASPSLSFGIYLIYWLQLFKSSLPIDWESFSSILYFDDPLLKNFFYLFLLSLWIGFFSSFFYFKIFFTKK